MPEILQPFIPKFLKPKPPEIKPPEIPLEELLPKEAPLALKRRWLLFDPQAIGRLVFAPLPRDFRVLTQKLPQLKETFSEVGITRMTELLKLKTAELTLPGLTEIAGLPTVRVEPGKFALPRGVPVAELSAKIKEKLPTEIVFAKTGGGLIDFNATLTLTEKGKAQQKITTVSGKSLELVIKPDKPVKSIKGYVVFKSKKPRASSFQVPLNSLTASLFFAKPAFAQNRTQPVEVEEKLVLLEFEYTDPDGDGIYTAEIQAPLVDGEYEIITVMDYEDESLGMKEVKLITVVDPEGYIYEKIGAKETRIPGAVASLYWLNSETKQYELWPAKEYQQENPQITDIRGTYSFLVPEGYYYLKVETPGYLAYDGKPFQVTEGSGVHINIELKTKYWWLKVADYKTMILLLVIILLCYNFYRDRVRGEIIVRIFNKFMLAIKTRLSKLLAVFAVAILLAVVSLGAKNYIEVKKELQATKEALKIQKINDKNLGFTKLFIEQVLQAEKEIDFETRLKLENAVRGIGDEEIFTQWQKFIESKTEAEAQKGVKNLLDLLVHKIQT